MENEIETETEAKKIKKKTRWKQNLATTSPDSNEPWNYAIGRGRGRIRRGNLPAGPM